VQGTLKGNELLYAVEGFEQVPDDSEEGETMQLAVKGRSCRLKFYPREIQLMGMSEFTAGIDKSANIHESPGVWITGVNTPEEDTHAANKAYVDAKVEGLQIKASVRCLSAHASDLSTAFAAGQSLDDQALIAGDRILLNAQSTPSENGIYVVTAGAAVRAGDLPDAAAALSVFVFVEEGTAYKDTGWVCTADRGADVVGTNDLSFTQFSSSATPLGDGINTTATGNSIDLNANIVLSTIGATTVNATTIKTDLVDVHDGTKTYFKFNPGDRRFSAYTLAEEETFFVVANTGMVVGNSFTARSDRRLKQNIETIQPSTALAAVRRMRACSYAFTADPADQRCGVIAQELQAVAPELVKASEDEAKTLAVNYHDMTAYLIGAIQALADCVDEGQTRAPEKS
jgi:hypothetical protein